MSPAAEATPAQQRPLDPPEAALDGGKPPRKEDILEKLGQSETKSADPQQNPLENKSDDLLKDLK